MAEINLERKERSSGAPWLALLALVVVALLVWWAWPDDGEEDLVAGVAVEEVEPGTEAGAETMTEQPGVPVANIAQNPVTWAGQAVSGDIQVVEVPTDRGFWIEENGQRVFVVMHVDGTESPPHVQANSTVRLSRAMVHGTDQLDTVVGTLDDQTRSILEGQQVFLLVEPQNVQVIM